MTNNINLYNTLASVLDYLQLDAENTTLLSCSADNGCCELTLSTDWLFYSCYVDCASGEVLGCDCEPLADGGSFCMEYDGTNCAILMEELSTLSA